MKTVESFIGHLTEKGLADRTIKTYVGYLRTIDKYYPNNPIGYLESEIAAPTRNTAYTALRHWAEYQEDDTLIKDLDSPQMKRKLKGRGKKPSRSTRPIPNEELDRFLSRLNRTKGKRPEWVWPCIILMLRLGLRVKVDLFGLRKAELKEGLRSGRLQFETKRGKLRVLPVGPAREAVEILLKIPGWEDVGSLVARGRGIDKAYQDVYKVLKGIARAAKMDPKEMHPHRLRHTAAHKLWEKTKDILKVRDFLGHSNVATTERYLRGDRTDEIGSDLEGIYDDPDE